MMKPLCIYHGNCADGFGAAWAVWRHFGRGDGVEMYGATHQDPPPPVKNDQIVICVDFVFKRDVMLDWAKNAMGILVLDHHKSAMEDLAAPHPRITNMVGQYTGPLTYERFLSNCAQDRSEGIPDGCIYTLFDMDRSGAGITWDFFNPGVPRPSLINTIEDRDLWRFSLPNTRELQAAIFSYPYDFETWDLLFKANLETLRIEGFAIERKHHKDVAELVAAFRREMIIGGYWVPVANLPYTLTSDAGTLMCEPYAAPRMQGEIVTPPFACCYWDTPAGRVFSLRSREGGMDVSAIAKQYGGGGHRNASGFRLTHKKAFEMEREAIWSQ